MASRHALARLAYSGVLYLAAPLIWRRVWRESAPTHSRGERLGLIPRCVDERPCIWLHAASLGEVVTATPLIRALLARHSDYALVITTMTATGAERVATLFGDAVHHHFLPLDFPGATRRFVDRLQPALAIIAETELWPNLLHTCAARGVPIVIANGRLSAGAFATYRRFAALSRDMLETVAWVGAKSREDAERFRELGCPASRVAVTGALKFDIELNEGLEDESERLRTEWGERPVWVAGSTHPGEDEAVLEAHARLRERYPNALLVLVPRHPQRFDAVATLCRSQGLAMARHSRGELPGPETGILLGDTMGELMRFYGAADVAFVGGSLVPVGGHNLLEPAALGVAVISGPYLDNLREIADTLAEADARREVADGPALGEALVALFDAPDERRRLGAAGRAVVEANRGALTRTLEKVSTYLRAGA
ncbi:lipid IV(A) 3-deoxy-D-manno-octulosonic acid transferase [Halomonas sp. HP20-15]|uniref:lipid IV(A) 3-deoxy-D-manno-octulosonic acid transferase n=1 Tax=Halomonas sp. HP20-15 TaxID=3085901 RepID=UPI0029828F82|nr:lipid IV(A) 3-deoxy-D-manno-octulosonic acid transferase [Halomonas sp. HP20-15]MDW5375950.1 lipid IV(A) 3-deoxy-D-manno-octulosonic acid transferase [Halomonas sp. HP20-15]